MHQETCGFIGLFAQITRKNHKLHRLFSSTTHPLNEDIFRCITFQLANNNVCNIDVTGDYVGSYYDVASVCLKLHMMKMQFIRFVVGKNAIKLCAYIPDKYKTTLLNKLHSINLFSKN